VRLRFCGHSRATAMRCSSSRTLDNTRPSSPDRACRGRHPAASPGRDVSRMLRPSSSRRVCFCTSSGLPCRKSPGENRRGKIVRGHHRAAAASTKDSSPPGASASAGDSGCRSPQLRLAAQAGRRDAIAKPARFSGATPREKTVLRIVRGADARMREPGNHGAVPAQIAQRFEIRGRW